MSNDFSALDFIDNLATWFGDNYIAQDIGENYLEMEHPEVYDKFWDAQRRLPDNFEVDKPSNDLEEAERQMQSWCYDEDMLYIMGYRLLLMEGTINDCAGIVFDELKEIADSYDDLSELEVVQEIQSDALDIIANKRKELAQRFLKIQKDRSFYYEHVSDLVTEIFPQVMLLVLEKLAYDSLEWWFEEQMTPDLLDELHVE